MTNVKPGLTRKMITDMSCGSSTMSTEQKESCSRELSEFDDKNEILTVKYEDSDIEGEKRGSRVSAIITTGFGLEEDMDSSSDLLTPDVRILDEKILYSALLELRR